MARKKTGTDSTGPRRRAVRRVPTRGYSIVAVRNDRTGRIVAVVRAPRVARHKSIVIVTNARTGREVKVIKTQVVSSSVAVRERYSGRIVRVLKASSVRRAQTTKTSRRKSSPYKPILPIKKPKK
jgi:hypothetical protein